MAGFEQLKKLSESFDRYCISCYEQGGKGRHVKDKFICACCDTYNHVNVELIE